MAIDNASFISEMNASIPDTNDDRGEGAGQIRAVKNAVQSSFPNVDDAVEATAERMNEVFTNYSQPLGMVAMYSGDFSDLDDGWYPCTGDTYLLASGGSKLAPDLTGSFIRGSDSTGSDIGDTGGQDTMDITVNGHALTKAQMPSHAHKMFGIYQNSTNNTVDDADDVVAHWSDAGGYRMRKSDSGDPIVGTTSTEGGDQEHTHGLTYNNDNRPVFYTLAYIIYLKPGAVKQ